MDSTFICSRGRLLPVSIADTPSIMMLGSPPPPMRVGVLLSSIDTPGARKASAMKLRLAIGRFSTASRSTVKDRSPLVVWTIGDSALTCTVSVSPPTSIAMAPTDIRSPALTTTPVRRCVLNPSIVTCTVYRSGETLANVKSPLAFVNTAGSCVPRVSLISVTAAPGMTAPCGSLTVPVTDAVVTCAHPDEAIVSSATSAAAPAIPLRLVMFVSSSNVEQACRSGF